MNKGYRTQWAGQFAVASELTRRDYLGSIPLGNAPVRDLLCLSPKGRTFSVQVKSLSSKGFFPCQRKLVVGKHTDLYLVFVLIPTRVNKPLEFFVLTHEQFLSAWRRETDEAKKKETLRGRPYKQWADGISYKTLSSLGFMDKWRNLPD